LGIPAVLRQFGKPGDFGLFPPPMLGSGYKPMRLVPQDPSLFKARFAVFCDNMGVLWKWAKVLIYGMAVMDLFYAIQKADVFGWHRLLCVMFIPYGIYRIVKLVSQP